MQKNSMQQVFTTYTALPNFRATVSKYSTSSANIHVYFCFDNNTSGTVVGKAYMGSVCSKDPGDRTLISEWSRSDLHSGEVPTYLCLVLLI